MAISTAKRFTAAVSCALGLSLLVAACSGTGEDDDGGSTGGEQVADWRDAPEGEINALVVWSDQELEDFESMLAPFEEETGIEVNIETTRDINAQLETRLAGGNPPDVAGLPGPGVMADLARRGDLEPLPSAVTDVLEANYNPGVIEDSSVDGDVVGIFSRISVKGLLWYNPEAFSAGGYEVPEDWDSLVSTVDDIASSGTPPWGIGVESEATTGWPATDWIEDFLIRQSGPDAYDQWVDGELAWTSDEVKAAFEAFGQWATDPAYVAGGSRNVVNLAFGDSGNCMFSDPAECYLVHQASFMPGFFEGANDNAEAGTTYDFFLMPPIEHEAATYAGDLFGMFNDSEQAQALMLYLVSPEAQQIWVERGSAVSANQEVPLDAYPDDIIQKSAEQLLAMEEIRFDGSDSMPGEMNEAFWGGVLDYIQNPDSLDSVLEELDSVQESAYAE